MSAVDFDHVTLALGGRTVLSNISLSLDEGEFVGLLGANGSGKTTLIKAVLGLVRPKSGSISVFGHPVTRGNPAVGYLPQTRAARVELRISGRDFLACSIDGHRYGPPIPGAAGRREIERALDAVGAGALANRPLAEMSGGERQRLLLAEALIGSPRLLLLDEPLISLDPHQQQVVVDLARKLCREFHLTVLFSAHELNQLLGAIDRVLYLGRGQAALGPVAEVITPPTLSRLYGAPIDVVRANGHIFVMSGGLDIERDHHHDHAHL